MGKENSSNGKLGILMGGGPAPGINSVIHSATIEAVNNGLEVIGIYEGFKYLMEGRVVSKPLTIEDVSRIHLKGGCILYTSRANPTKAEGALERCGRALVDAGVKYLVAIGGDDTAFSAYKVADYAQKNLGATLQVVHVPKTIDNDLPLPEGIRTFGYETAREMGARIVRRLMEDALTSQRWFLVVSMGRKAGHLALGIGKSAGSTITLIPEEWKRREIRLQEVVDILAVSVIKRLAQGKRHGVAVVAEGVVEQLSHDDLGELDYVERDAHGHIRLSEINFSEILKKGVVQELRKVGIQMRMVDKDLGYELRCADPIAFDIDYTRSLGEAAVDFLLEGGSNATITIQQNQVVPIPFDDMMDPETGRTEVRQVKTDSFTFTSACKFMIRLKPEDADNEPLWEKMAAQTNLSVAEFKARYGYLINLTPCPY